MRLGYACVNTQLPSAARTVRLVHATPERILELAAANLAALDAILRWNEEHGIAVFRLTSDLVPLASHPAVAGLAWWDALAEELARTGALLARARVRASTHPGQYTVLGSERPAVVDAAIAELDYHARLLEALGLDASHKIVLHAPGAAHRDAADARFAAGFARLSPGAQARLVLENDERRPLDTVLPLARRVGVPVVFDAFHHTLAPSAEEIAVRDAVLLAAATWSSTDGRQEVHFSTQEPGKRRGAHGATLDLEAFAAFAEAVGDLPLDCVLEVKDKEQSVLRARALLAA
jgi:UV DNA damage endonuclease